MKDQVESTENTMTHLKITLNGVIEGLESFSNLSMETESLAVEGVRSALEAAQNDINTVKSRSGFMKYWKAGSDKGMIEDTVAVLNKALEGLMLKI